jgi:modulator of FtsH protease HflC
MPRRSLLVLIPLLLLWCLFTSMLLVEQADFVYVTQFGRHVVTHDGQTDAGLQWKLPWPLQSATRLDRRLRLQEVRESEFLIRDRDTTESEKPLPLTFDFFLAWRIGSAQSQPGADLQGVDRFVRSFGSPERAQTFLHTQLISRLRTEMSSLSLSQLINTDQNKLELRRVLEKVRRDLGGSTEGVGIVLIDVGVRRFNHPEKVRPQIFDKIRADRKRDANTYRIQGEEDAAKIQAEGIREASRIQAAALEEKLRLEGDADAEVTRILNEAHRQDPELYRVLRLVRGYRLMFGDDRTQLILSLDHPLLSLFREVPGAKNEPKTPKKEP